MRAAAATGAEVESHLELLHESVWQLAALAVALRDPATVDPLHRRAAEQVLVEAGLMVAPQGGAQPSPGLRELIGTGAGGPNATAAATALASEAAAGISQSAALLSGARAWSSHDDEAFLAQGLASAQMAVPFKTFVLPALAGLDELLSGPSPVMLDVGVGVGELAVAFCHVFPGLRIVGLDVVPRALALAHRTVENTGLADRIELRLQDVAELADARHYCLGWLPAQFLPRPALEAGLPRLVTALVPGGWLVMGHGKVSKGGLTAALARFHAATFGGTALGDGDAQRLLRGAGLELVATLPTPDDAPALTVGRRPVMNVPATTTGSRSTSPSPRRSASGPPRAERAAGADPAAPPVPPRRPPGIRSPSSER